MKPTTLILIQAFSAVALVASVETAFAQHDYRFGGGSDPQELDAPVTADEEQEHEWQRARRVAAGLKEEEERRAEQEREAAKIVVEQGPSFQRGPVEEMGAERVFGQRDRYDNHIATRLEQSYLAETTREAQERKHSARNRRGLTKRW